MFNNTDGLNNTLRKYTKQFEQTFTSDLTIVWYVIVTAGVYSYIVEHIVLILFRNPKRKS